MEIKNKTEDKDNNTSTFINILIKILSVFFIILLFLFLISISDVKIVNEKTINNNTIEGDFGLKLGEELDLSVVTSFDVIDNFYDILIHRVKPHQPNIIFDDYTVVVDINNTICSICARKCFDTKKESIEFKNYLLNFYKEKYNISDDNVTEIYGQTVLWQSTSINKKQLK